MGSSKTGGLAPGFIPYALGISVWMILVSCSGSTYMFPLIPSQADPNLYVIVQQVFYVATYFIAAGAEYKFGPLKPDTLCHVATGAFAASVIIIGAVFIGIEVQFLLVAGGACVGIGLAAGFIQWIRIVMRKSPQETKILLIIASGVSVVSSVLFCFVPVEGRALLYGIALVPVSAILFYYNTKINGVEQADNTIATVDGGARRMFSEIAIPLICAVVLVLVAPIASSTYVDTTGQDIFRQLLAQAANLVALVILAVVLLGLKKNIELFGTYCVLLPVLASSVLFASLFTPDQRWFVLFLGDISFCIVSFLMMLTCYTISKRSGVSVIIVYGFFGGCVYLARLPEILLVLAPGLPAIALESFAVAALLIYILTIPVFFLPFLRRQTEQNWKRTMESFTSVDLSEACDYISEEHKLPQRQRDVLKMLISGRDIPHISDTLHLAPNTVRTYRKALYASLNVHSKQELLDLIESTMHFMHDAGYLRR